MKRIRLLPIVVLAMSALLVLKGVGLITHGGYILAGVQSVRAQTADVGAPANPAQDGADTTQFSASDLAAADRASETLFDRAAPPPSDSSQIDAVPYTKTKAGEKIPVRADDGVSDTERAVLERLSDRRAELDQRAKDLDNRQALVEAAEKRLDERINELKRLEAQINALVDEKKKMEDEQFKGLVSMYEAMKPKAAAEIFDQLSMDVLLRVATAMNPRKMSPVLAAMTPDKAQQLTVLMASDDGEPTIAQAGDDLSSLPQIVGN